MINEVCSMVQDHRDRRKGGGIDVKEKVHNPKTNGWNMNDIGLQKEDKFFFFSGESVIIIFSWEMLETLSTSLIRCDLTML